MRVQSFQVPCMKNALFPEQHIRSSIHSSKWKPTAAAFLTGTFLLLFSTVKAQYTQAIGGRFGETSGLTYKRFTDHTTAFEGIAGVWQRGLSFTVLYEKYFPAFGAANLNWYGGGGIHTAFQTGTTVLYPFGQRRYYYNEGGLGLGIDGVFGLEYTIPWAPVAISFDFKPFIEFNTSGGAWLSLDPGFQLKAVF